MVWTRFIRTALRDSFRSQVAFAPSSESARDPGSRSHLLMRHRCASQRLLAQAQ